jgi:hypothetical protein
MADDDHWTPIRRREMPEFYVVKNVAWTERPIRRRIAVHVMFSEDLVLVCFELLVTFRVLSARHRYSSTTKI